MLTRTYLDFPTTRYQGSKKRLLPWIHNTLSEIEFDSFLDVFGGTGAVSYLAKTMGKQVTFNDYLSSNVISANALIKNNSSKFDLCKLDGLLSSNQKEGFVTTIFDGIFFTREENIIIDTLINNICFDDELKVRGRERDIALHALFQALLMKRPFNLFHRANLDIRQTECQRKFGNKTTWEKSIGELMYRNIKEVNHAVFDNGKKHSVLNRDALKIKKGYDLVYLDPPYYPKDEFRCINYYAYYNFLEGLCDYQGWESRINRSLKNLRMFEKEASFNKRGFADDFARLLQTHQESTIVCSYKSPGYPSINDLAEICKETHNAPTVVSKEHHYSLNKNNGHYRENLLVAYPFC